MGQGSAKVDARGDPGTAVVDRGVCQGQPAGQVLLGIGEGVAVVLVPGEFLGVARLLVDRLVPVEPGPRGRAHDIVAEVLEDLVAAERFQRRRTHHQVDGEGDRVGLVDEILAVVALAQLGLVGLLQRVDGFAQGGDLGSGESILEQEEALLVVLPGLLLGDQPVRADRWRPGEGGVEGMDAHGRPGSMVGCTLARSRALRQPIGRDLRRKVEMAVGVAAGIEAGVAGGALAVAGEIFGDRELVAAGAAEDGGLVEFGGRPDLGRVIGQGVVAVAAGVIGFAAAHLDGDDVQLAVPMGAAGLRVEIEAMDGRGQGRLLWLSFRGPAT